MLELGVTARREGGQGTNSKLFICVCILFFSLGVLAQDDSTTTEVDLTLEEKAWVERNNPVTVGAGLDWAPFDFVLESGGYGGLSWDYLQEISARTGLEFKVELDLWHVNLEKAENNRVGILPAVFKSNERQKSLLFSQPYFKTVEFFFIRNDIEAHSAGDLNGLRVAIPRDFAHVEFLQKNYPEVEIVLVDTIGQAIDAVIEGQAELLYETYVSVEYLLQREGIKSIKPFLSSRSESGESLHFAVPKRLPVLHSIIEKGLASIGSKERREINQRWMSRESYPLGTDLTFTKGELDWLEANEGLRFGGDPNWMPYEAFDENGRYIGIVSDYLSLIERKLDVQFRRVETGSWAETIDYVRNDRLDIVSETSGSPLSEHVVFTKSYLSSPIVIVMRDDTDYVESINQISNKTIALIKDYGYVEEVKTKYSGIDFKTVEGIQEGLTFVSTGKVDTLIATLAQASYHISDLGINNIRIVGQTEFRTNLAFGVRKEYSSLVPIINKAIDSISPIERQKILDTWGKEKFASKTNYDFVWKVVFVSLCLFLAILLWNRKLLREISLRRQAEDQTQKLIDNIPAQVFVTDLDGYVLNANPQFLADFEFLPGEAIGFNVDDLYLSFSDKEDIVQTLMSGGHVKNKVIKLQRKGCSESHSLMLSVLPIQYNNKHALLAIAVDLNERLEIEEQLRKAKDDAEIAARSKAEFLANMSHEIRTPMNAIVGFTELLDQKIQDKKLRSYIKTIQSSGRNLLLIINDVLDLSKVESGGIRINKSPAKPKDLFDELFDIFKLSISEKGLRMYFDISSEIPEVLLLDIARLRQVLINLLGNAIKFTDNGYVKLSVSVEDMDVSSSRLNLKIDVSDTGVGIPEEDIDSIFDKFHQADETGDTERGGTGLGLTICERLVTLMGGAMSVTSKVGEGSTLSIHLKDIDVVSVDEVETESSLGELSDAFVRFESSRILVVDDVDINRTLVKDSLESLGLIFFEACNGQEAVNICREQDVDLVLMDLRMPVMNGYDAAEVIKNEQKVIVVALTASVMKAELDRLNETSNFDGYLRKPVTKTMLVNKLMEFLPHQHQAFESGDDFIEFKGKEPFSTELKEEICTLANRYENILENNNLAEMAKYAAQVIDTADKHSNRSLQSVATELKNSVDNFDISAINDSLRVLSQLYRSNNI